MTKRTSALSKATKIGSAARQRDGSKCEKTGSQLPTYRRTQKPKTRPCKINELEGQINHLAPRLSLKNMTRQRRRTVGGAINYLDRETTLAPTARHKAIIRIIGAKQPKTEAKRIIDAHRRNSVEIEVDQIDLSHAQELRVTLIRRDGGVWSPQREFLKRMEIEIAQGAMSPEKFAKHADVFLRMPQALGRNFRKREGGPSA